MKISTKKLALTVLSVVLAVCTALTAASLIKDVAHADDQTEVSITFSGLLDANNNPIGSPASFYLTRINFDKGVSTGVKAEKDFSDLNAKTTYTGSATEYYWQSGNDVGFPVDTSYAFIYLKTITSPVAGDTISVQSGAWFTTGGTINEKYIIAEDMVLNFNGTAWVKCTAFTPAADVWAGADQSGKKGAQLTAWGIANDGGAAAYPTTGTFALLNVSSALNVGPTANQAGNITSIKYNGTPIKDVEGAVVAEWFTYLAIYLPYRTGIVSFEKYAVIGSKYVASDCYYSLSTVSGHGRMTVINYSDTTSFAFSESGTGILWNGNNQGGSAINGIANDATPPAVGACNLINVANNGLLAHNIDNNLVYGETGKTVLCDGTPLSEISGSYIGVFAGYIFIYVPSNDSIVTIQEGTRFGQGYYADKDYKYHFKNGVYQSSLCRLVEFDSNGGSAVESAYVHNGQKVSAPTAPTKTVGETFYVLDCWVDENGDEFDFDTAITDDITLTATWKAVEAMITVTFDSNGGSEIAGAEVEKGSAVAEPENPTKADAGDEYYTFEYWYLDDENTPYDFSSAVTEDITLTAKWAANTRERVEIAFDKIADQNNAAIGSPAKFYLTRLCFNKNISAGVAAEKDLSNLTANTTYSGSATTWHLLTGNDVGLDVNSTAYNFMFLQTMTAPEVNDTLVISVGAWFTVGGTVTDKYVLTEEITLRFDGYGWGEIKPFAIDGIVWNGADMSGKNGAQLTAWGIENNGADAALPLSGTCALLKVGTFYALPTDNLAASVTGIEYDGAPINEIEGAVVAEWLGHLFIYVPNRSGLITIKEGAFILNDYADKDYYFILTEHSTVAVWTEAYEPENIDGEWIDLYGKQRVAFAGVNYQHNNARNYGSGESRLVQTILVFDYTEENKPEADENGNLPVLMLGQASNPAQSAAASRITVNGVKLSEIPGATVDYSQGFNYVYIVMPESAVLPTAEYPNAKLVIKANTVFEDSVLPEVTLTLLGGIWVNTDAESVELSPDGYKTVSDLTGSGKINVAEYDTVMNPIDFDGNLDFRFIISPASLVNDGIPNAYLELCLLSTQEQNWDGFRFDFKYDFTKTSYVIDVYDASYISMEEIENGGTGLKLLATIPIGLAAKDYSAFVIKITENDGVYSITVVENGLKLAEVTDIAPRGDRIGSSTLLYALNTSWTLADYKAGDVAVPYVYSLTKEVYFLEEGDSVPEFEYRVYDRTDAAEDVTCEVIVNNDAIEDGKIKAGEWTFLIRATDLNGNTFEREIKLFVSGEQKFTVTFDGKNAAEYAYGSLIVEPQNPEKAGNKKVYYVFDGWYNGEEKWDFANDTVEADLNLVAKYEEKDVLYRITFTGGVEEDITVYAKYGAQLDLSFLDKEGFVTAFTVGGKNATMIQVTEDVTVRVSYEIEKVVEEESEEELVKSGCFSGISGGSAVIALTLLAALVILKKKENKNEE